MFAHSVAFDKIIKNLWNFIFDSSPGCFVSFRFFFYISSILFISSNARINLYTAANKMKWLVDTTRQQQLFIGLNLAFHLMKGLNLGNVALDIDHYSLKIVLINNLNQRMFSQHSRRLNRTARA